MSKLNQNVLVQKLEELVGQEIYEADSKSEALRKRALQIGKNWSQVKGEAETAEQYSKCLREMAIAYDKDFDAEWLEFRITGEFKKAASLNAAKGNSQEFYDFAKANIHEALVASVPEYFNHAQDLADYRACVNAKAVLSECLRSMAADEKGKANELYSKATGLFEERARLFAEADQILVNAGMGTKVEQMAAERKAKIKAYVAKKQGAQHLEEAIAQYVNAD